MCFAITAAYVNSTWTKTSNTFFQDINEFIIMLLID